MPVAVEHEIAGNEYPASFKIRELHYSFGQKGRSSIAQRCWPTGGWHRCFDPEFEVWGQAEGPAPKGRSVVALQNAEDMKQAGEQIVNGHIQAQGSEDVVGLATVDDIARFKQNEASHQDDKHR